MKKRPTAFNLVATFLCLFGIGLISLSSDFSISFGDAMTLVCAFFYAVQIVMMSMLGEDHDATVLTMWQFVAVAVCSVVPALLFEPAPDWGAIPASCLPSMAYLAVACTAVALLFMNVGIKHVPPATAGLLLSFESVFGALFSVLLGAEALTPRLFAGFVAVFASVVVSEYLPEKFKPQKASE
jgi:drug/metabolite transporter (DMT)-like permease